MGCVMLEAASTGTGEKRLSCDTVSNPPWWNCYQTPVWRPQQLPYSSFVWGPVTFGFDPCTGMVSLLGAGNLILLLMSLVLMTLLGMLVRPRPSPLDSFLLWLTALCFPAVLVMCRKYNPITSSMWRRCRESAVIDRPLQGRKTHPLKNNEPTGENTLEERWWWRFLMWEWYHSKCPSSL